MIHKQLRKKFIEEFVLKRGKTENQELPENVGKLFGHKCKKGDFLKIINL